MKEIEPYSLPGQYEELVSLVRRCAPPDVTEVWGVVRFEGISDFRLNYGKFRLIELAPMATRIGVFMEWRKVFRQPEIYGDDPHFDSFEDSFGYLGVNDNWNQPWNVYSGTDLSAPYVETFLVSGMRLMVKEIERLHPTNRFT